MRADPALFYEQYEGDEKKLSNWESGDLLIVGKPPNSIKPK